VTTGGIPGVVRFHLPPFSSTVLTQSTLMIGILSVRRRRDPRCETSSFYHLVASRSHTLQEPWPSFVGPWLPRTIPLNGQTKTGLTESAHGFGHGLQTHRRGRSFIASSQVAELRSACLSAWACIVSFSSGGGGEEKNGNQRIFVAVSSRTQVPSHAP
jgi:hypothetical protein